MKRRARLAAVLSSVLLLLLTACEKDAPQDYLQGQSGSFAERADSLWDVTFVIAVVIFFLVEGILVFALIRFRQRPGREAAQFHGNTKVEVILTVIPALILAGLAIPTTQSIFALADVPDNAMEVKVVARQFWWEYQYDVDSDGEVDVINANELHLPVDIPVHFTIEGDVINDDVIHSFWIPRLAGTQDAVPGRQNFLVTTPRETGTFMGQCKEYCGLSHANMRIIAKVQTQDEFATWVEEQQEPAAEPSESLAQEGMELFAGGSDGNGTFAAGPACATCHTIDGLEGAVGTVGPNLTHLASRETFAGALFDLDEGNLTDWVLGPDQVKPGVRMPDVGLTQEEAEAIVAYLMSLE